MRFIFTRAVDQTADTFLTYLPAASMLLENKRITETGLLTTAHVSIRRHSFNVFFLYYSLLFAPENGWLPAVCYSSKLHEALLTEGLLNFHC